MQAGERGMQQEGLLQTDRSGDAMSKPCVPPGTERIKVKVRYQAVEVRSKLGFLDGMLAFRQFRNPRLN